MANMVPIAAAMVALLFVIAGVGVEECDDSIDGLAVGLVAQELCVIVELTEISEQFIAMSAVHELPGLVGCGADVIAEVVDCFLAALYKLG